MTRGPTKAIALGEAGCPPPVKRGVVVAVPVPELVFVVVVPPVLPAAAGGRRHGRSDLYAT